MKVKEKLGERRGRPRKYAQGEMRSHKLWLPENLLMELRVAARVRGYTTNDELISRLVASLRFSPRRNIIKTDNGQRLVALARLFDEFIQAQLDIIREEHAAKGADTGGGKSLFPVKTPRSAVVSRKTFGQI